MKLKRDLSYFDMTNIVIGGVIGTDIYIISALTAGLLGPFSIMAWIIAGIISIILAMVFAYCSYYVPKVGGSFAYASIAFDKFFGFLTGWSMWIAEVLAFPVYAIAFTQYLQYLTPLTDFQQILVKVLLLFGLTFANVVGVKKGGLVNDILTIGKLIPLFLLVLFGVISLAKTSSLFSNYSDFIPLGLNGFGTALVLIFWAYAGFELGTMPASEIKNPKITIPKAIITGMIIVTLFYLSINFVVYGLISWKDLAKTSIPLVLAGSILFGTIGAIIMSLGALVSISGVDDAEMLGTARLSYAMSIDGLFPKIFSKIHPKYRTPYIGLIVQGVVGFVFSLSSDIGALISFAVFNLAFSYLFVCLSLVVLKKEKEKKLIGENILPWIGVAVCLYLLYSTSVFDKIVGTILILVGIPIFTFASPKKDIRHLKRLFTSEEAILTRRLERKEKFLANFVRIVHRFYKNASKF